MKSFLNPSIESLPANPFAALSHLLSDVRPPSSADVLNAAVGDPQGDSSIPVELIAANGNLWGRYPPLIGTEELRSAVLGWLERRFELRPGWLGGQIDILPTAGTREALFLAAAMAVPWGDRHGVVLMPNPSYPGYTGSAIMAGAEPIFVPARAENGYLPDYEALGADTLNRTALAYLTNPTNPEGAAAPPDYLARMLRLSERFNFVLAVDECCIDLYTRDKPVGVLSVCHDQGLPTDRLLVFNSLSKRSLAAGLRSGFIAGAPALIATMRNVRSFTGATIPLPLQAASAALWADDRHVDHIRGDLDEKFTFAETVLGDAYGRVRPSGGFFLWLRVGDDLALAQRAWSHGLKIMPGSILGHGAGDENPGRGYIRVALVHRLPEAQRLITMLRQFI